MLHLILFLLCAWVMIIFARRLTASGENLGEVLGMEASWVGVLLLASITSLPELIVGITSTTMGNHSMAVSNIFGSNIFNVFIIFIVDLFVLKNFTFMKRVERDEGISMVRRSILLSLVFIGGFLVRENEVLGQSPSILLIILIYLSFLRGEGGQKKREGVELQKVWKPVGRFVLDSAGVVVLGIILSRIADSLTMTPIMGFVLGQTLVGGVLLAVSTSLPELTVSIESVRRGGYQQAMGNILGSNLFNMGTLFVLDLFTRGGLMKSLQDFNPALPVMDLMMQGVLLLGLTMQRRGSSILVGAVYLLSLYFIV